VKDRVVSRLLLDDEDEISYLFGPWGAVASSQAAEQIQTGAGRYFVLLHDGFLAEVRVVEGEGRRHFHADCGGSPTNGLDEVPKLA
jgi:hypothetical protein